MRNVVDIFVDNAFVAVDNNDANCVLRFCNFDTFYFALERNSNLLKSYLNNVF